MRNKKPRYLASILFTLFISIPAPLNAGTPTDVIRRVFEKIQAVLKNPRLQPHARSKERRKQLRQAFCPRFDFTENAKRSLGSHWRHRTSKEQHEFVTIFRDRLESLYLDRVESYRDVKFFYTRETQDKNYAAVDAKVLTKKGGAFTINYRLHLTNGKWKLYDIVTENTSLVNNYRSRFNRIITNSSYKELLRRMTEKRASDGIAEKIDSEKRKAIQRWMMMILVSEGSKV
ncbi:MAG: phospholipid-binding protein MlaC [Candidatus Binatia bacterium]